MGTHISKVKSVDLDVWTVEQMNVSTSAPLFKASLTSFFVVNTEMGQPSRQSVLGGSPESRTRSSRSVRGS